MKQTKLMTVVCFILVLGCAAVAGAADAKKRIMVFGDSNTFGYFEDAQGNLTDTP